MIKDVRISNARLVSLVPGSERLVPLEPFLVERKKLIDGLLV